MQIHDRTRWRIASLQEKVKQAEDVKKLKERWKVFPFPVQEALVLHLHLYGVSSVQDTTDILERLCKANAMKGSNL